MNRIGINLWNWSNDPSIDYIKWMAHAKELGFSAVELPMIRLDMIQWNEIGRFAQAQNLEITMCASLPAGRDISSFKEEERENAKEYLLRCCQIGAIVGAKVLAGPVYSGGGKRHTLSEEQKQLEWDYAVQGLREIAAEAKKSGVKLGIEPINRYRTSMVNTVEQGLQMTADINMENVGLLYDTYQANIEERNMADALRKVAELGKLVHFHACENNREAPGDGHIDWQVMTEILKQCGYTGHYTMELFCQGGLDASWQEDKDRDETARSGLKCLSSYIKSQ